MNKDISVIPTEQIEKSIYLIRGERVMLDSDLADLYDVEVKVLNRATKINPKRFPSDFMFQLNYKEVAALRSQNMTSNKGRGGHRTLPYAFTERGVIMLASVLDSPIAIKVSIQIVRDFVRQMQLLSTRKDLAQEIDNLEKMFDAQFKIVFDAIRKLMEPSEEKKKGKSILTGNMRTVNIKS
jgi:hypothetical protein